MTFLSIYSALNSMISFQNMVNECQFSEVSAQFNVDRNNGISHRKSKLNKNRRNVWVFWALMW